MNVIKAETGNRIQDALAGDYTCRREEGDIVPQTYYDTFDWSLFRDGKALILQDDTFRLVEFSTETPVASLGHEAGGEYLFEWDFPDSELRDCIGGMIGVRALMPVCSIRGVHETVHIMNDDLKTVVRLSAKRLEVAKKYYENQVFEFYTLIPLKGYEEDYKNCRSILIDGGVISGDSTEPVLTRALSLFGRAPGDYSSGIYVALKPEMTVTEAACHILYELFRRISRNELGVLEDVDTEFLHDFRVASRRARSALGQMPFAFDAEIKSALLSDLKRLGKITNRARDLDVYILDKESMTKLVPETFREYLAPFFSDLEAERNREIETLRTRLTSDWYVEMKARWVEYLRNPDNVSLNAPVEAQMPVAELAKVSILKRFKKVTKRGKKISPSSPDEQLHALRINCKKLRYLLELYRSLFDDKTMGTMIRQLKKLQNVLGRFNDLSVQIETLIQRIYHVQNNTDNTDNSGMQLAALGMLVGVLKHQKQVTRDGFYDAFDRFNKKKNTLRYHDTFGSDS